MMSKSNVSKPRYNPAAAAKSLQLCPTLCDPIDRSPPGSPVPGILQARTLKWVAISFSNAWKWKVKVKSLSCVCLFVTPWTAAYRAPPSMGFSRQEYWSGVPSPSPDIILDIFYSSLFSFNHVIIVIIKCSCLDCISTCLACFEFSYHEDTFSPSNAKAVKDYLPSYFKHEMKREWTEGMRQEFHVAALRLHSSSVISVITALWRCQGSDQGDYWGESTVSSTTSL